MEYLEDVKEAIEDDYSFEDLANDLFQKEDNYNNADPTSKQTCHTEEEILSMIEDCFEHIKQDENHCSECGTYITDESLITETQKHPYGDTYAEENIVIGYKCCKCGNRGGF